MRQTIIYATHDQTEVMTLANKLALMKDGEIVESGTVAQVFDRPEHPYTRTLLAATS